MKEILTTILNAIGWAYWVKIETETPSCTYYFGPFISCKEAERAKLGYVEDLAQEGAAEITTKVSRCKPTQLTVIKERDENLDFKVFPAFGHQS